MKAATLFVISLVLCPSPIHAFCRMQGAPEIELIGFRWRKLPLARDLNPKKTTQEEILSNHHKRYEMGQPEPGQLRNEEALNNSKSDSLKAPIGADRPYEYRIRIKNTSAKTITSLTWTYIFSDPVTGQELLRRSFESNVKIDRGKKKQVSVSTHGSPPNVVNANAKDNKTLWKEAVIIEKIEYADGAVWKRK